MCLILTLALMGVEIRHTLRALGEIKKMFEGSQPERGPRPPPNFMLDGHPQGPVGFLVSYAPALMKVETR